MQNFTPEQVNHLNIIAAFARQQWPLPCPKKIVHAVANAKIMLETGRLDPLSEQAEMLYEVMAVLEKAPFLKDIAKRCRGCDG